jgi:hypothetical protein
MIWQYQFGQSGCVRRRLYRWSFATGRVLALRAVLQAGSEFLKSDFCTGRLSYFDQESLTEACRMPTQEKLRTLIVFSEGLIF